MTATVQPTARPTHTPLLCPLSSRMAWARDRDWQGHVRVMLRCQSDQPSQQRRQRAWAGWQLCTGDKTSHVRARELTLPEESSGTGQDRFWPRHAEKPASARTSNTEKVNRERREPYPRSPRSTRHHVRAEANRTHHGSSQTQARPNNFKCFPPPAEAIPSHPKSSTRERIPTRSAEHGSPARALQHRKPERVPQALKRLGRVRRLERCLVARS